MAARPSAAASRSKPKLEYEIAVPGVNMSGSALSQPMNASGGC